MSDLLERLQAALADGYAVQREIGSGGMATVFLAEDLKHHREVAVKVLHPELAAAVGPDRFLREIEAVAGLTHPHVLPLYDSGEANGLLFYIMPYVEGESLRQRLERDNQLPVEEAIRIAQEVADALDHAHRHRLIHRDIKPGNILLEEGHAVVTDFGVARAISEARGEKVTATGMAVGTPAYMSPEQAVGEEVDETSDIYALGCVLYEMLAGEPPLVGSTPQSTAAKRLTDRPTPLPALRDTVSPQLSLVVEKGLSRTPADRYATAPEFAEALGSITTESVGSRAAPLGRRGIWSGLAITAVVSAAAAGWLLLRPSTPTHSPDPDSIAVLPFADMSPDKDQEYFSDGISEELGNLLAKIPELRVTPRRSAFYFKGQHLGIREIAERLNVAYILDGSVRKAGNQVRVTAQLIEAHSDTQMWSETWDRSLDDIFAIQDEITARVVEQLRVSLLTSVPTVEETDPAGYALYLQARQLSQHGTSEGYRRSEELYREVLAVDPDYAPAWAGLARSYFGQAFLGVRQGDEGYPLAREAARRALESESESAEAHALLGRITALHDRDLAAAARHLERALELDPANPTILAHAAVTTRNLGRLEESITVLEYVVAHDPLDPTWHARLGLSYLYSGRLDEAISSFRTALSLSPDFPTWHAVIGLTLLYKGEPEAALAEMQRESSEAFRLLGLSAAHHALGQMAESDATIGEAIEKYDRHLAYAIAAVMAYSGKADSAFLWLDKAVQYDPRGLAEIPVDNAFANIHDDLRWLPFLESIGKSPEQLAAIEFEATLPQ